MIACPKDRGVQVQTTLVASPDLNLHLDFQERTISADSLLRYQRSPKMFPDWRAGPACPGGPRNPRSSMLTQPPLDRIGFLQPRVEKRVEPNWACPAPPAPTAALWHWNEEPRRAYVGRAGGN